jgi:hypothetical protein
MKKSFTLIALLCAFASCSTKSYLIGMSENDFIKQNHGAELVQASGQTTVYKTDKVILGSYNRNIKYYYFNSHQLVRIDQGVRQPDVLIQNNH